jgi:hypothetical protein
MLWLCCTLCKSEVPFGRLPVHTLLCEDDYPGNNHSHGQGIVAYRPAATRRLFKQRSLLGNARIIHERNNKPTGLCNPFLSRRSVNKAITTEVLSETVFSIRSVHSDYKEELVENRQPSSGLPSEQLVESWALQGRLSRWRCEFRCGVLIGVATEAEESPLLRFVTRKGLVKTLQRNSHCWELLPSNDYWKQTKKT